MLLVSRAMEGAGDERERKRERELLHVSEEDWEGQELSSIQLYLYGLMGTFSFFLFYQVNKFLANVGGKEGC